MRLQKLKLTIVGVYRPPNTSETQFCNELNDQLEQLSQMSTLIIGDLNMNLLLTSNTISQYRTAMESNGFVLLNGINESSATRRCNSVSTIIDHALTNCLRHEHKIALVDNSFSDHRHIILNIAVNLDKIRNPFTNKGCKTYVNYENITKQASRALENEHLTIDDFQSQISEIIKNNTTRKDIRVKAIKFRNP